MKNGMILYEDQNTVSIITWNSSNQKTGDMAQVIVLVKNIPPIVAAKTGADSLICFNCKHRPINLGSCYVNLAYSPTAIYNAYKLGKYDDFDPDLLIYKLKHRYARLTSYGDPVLIPIHIFELIVNSAKGYTAYSHL